MNDPMVVSFPISSACSIRVLRLYYEWSKRGYFAGFPEDAKGSSTVSHKKDFFTKDYKFVGKPLPTPFAVLLFIRVSTSLHDLPNQITHRNI